MSPTETYNTATELAKLLRITSRRVGQLVKEGVIKKEADGKFDTPQALEDYFAFKFKDENAVDYEKERAKHEAAKREKAEIELALLKGEVLDAREIEQLQANMIITFRSRILSMGSKCAPKLLGQKSIPVITEIINIEAHEALNELKQIPAEKLGDNRDEDE